MHLIHRQTCRCCGSTALTQVNDLGNQHLQGSFVKPGKELPPMRRVPLSLMRCDPTRDEGACGLLQLRHSVPPEILYSHYWYRSGTNQTMTRHLQSISAEITELLRQKEARVLDIGCNDGTLLQAYPAEYGKFGVDPSDVAEDIPDSITVVKDLFPSRELTEVSDGMPFHAITSIAMFYDLEDPVDFARQIKKQLWEEGLWVVEMSYMPTMLGMNAYDTICHEHLEYYSLAVLEYIADAADLKIFKADLNDINGGSIRCYLTHKDCFRYKDDDSSDVLTTLRQQEFELGLDTDKPYRKFQERIEVHRDRLRAMVRSLKQEGKSIHIYGASTKGNTILQFCGFDSTVIDYAADRNEEKHGARTLGTEIPIISEAESRAIKPDYYLVLPWHFRDEFLVRERETIMAGTSMIFPLPEIEIVTADNYESALEGKSP